ncbi:MAG: FtsX-like permease family protein [Anaerolineae bacterium]
MELGTRWQKILRDVWGNKTRSLLVILSIAVGVATVGMINNTMHIIRRDLYGIYGDGNPAGVELYVSPFPEQLADAVEGLNEVAYAEPRRTQSAVIHTAAGAEEDIALVVAPDLAVIEINRLTLEQGSLKPGIREIVLERNTAAKMGVRLGDTVQIELGSARYDLTVTGIAHDLYTIPLAVLGEGTGYVTMETLQWMGQYPYYNLLLLIPTENQTSKEHVMTIGALARDRIIEPSGFQVYRISTPGIGADPGQHWAQGQINGFVLILQVMSIMAIFLSGGLVVNTISAILSQQVRQIGIMRSIGANRRQLISMYLVNVLIFSAAGLVIGYPLGLLGTIGLGSLASSFLNFDVTSIVPPLQVAALQGGVGLMMPVIVAFFPIVSGMSMSSYSAIYQQVSGKRSGRLENVLGRLRALPPAVMLSLRNTFRKKARLAFTLITLILAGAMFMAVFSTRASLTQQIREIVRYFDYDASLSVPGGANRSTIEREAYRIPGVVVAEAWSNAAGVYIRPDDSEGEALQVIGIPFNSQTVDPLLLEGRWLQEGDTTQVVVNEDLTIEEPGVVLGGPITVRVNGREQVFEVVGIVSKHLSGPRVYATYAAWGDLTGRHNQADEIRVRLDADTISTAEQQDWVAARLEDRFENAGLSSGTAQTQHVFFSTLAVPFNIILIVLVIMASLLAVVGGLSLTGTMGINVMERTREIGVLRAVGADNGSVRQVVVVEGVVVGLISWLVSALLSAPVGRALAGAVTQAIFETEVVFRYSFPGLLVWLALTVLIGIAASLAPARKASRLTVREVLDYE